LCYVLSNKGSFKNNPPSHKATEDKGGNMKHNNLPTIILPGFFTAFWPSSVSLIKDMKKEGYTIAAPKASLLSLFGIHAQAVSLSNLVNETLKKYNTKKCNIIGISKGGIVALYYLHELGGTEKVNIFITISTPFRGAWIALLTIFFPGGREILPTSSVIKKLLRKPKPPGVKIYTLSADKDKIADADTNHYKNVRNKTFRGGHSDICRKRNDAVLSYIKHLLAKQ